MSRRIGIVLALVLVLGWVAARLANAVAKPNHELGVHGDRLANCPDTPNCVSSEAAGEKQRVEPLQLAGSVADSMARLAATLESVPRVRIVSSDERYLHAECRSWLLGFVDDLEFLVDSEGGVMHVRSASRVGYSDLGVNRARVEELRTAFATAN